ncbi:MAG: HEPN domain-containing protein [Thermodesulfobacteria bacterium]|nr:HEPN domain-containing protein [Thermodesulfobacteriota bacterium]
MSVKKNLEDARRWLRTAEMDLRAARILAQEGEYALSCFHAHQCGEKALKALWNAHDISPWGHSLVKLIRELERVDLQLYTELKGFLETAAALDKYYIPTRYPNGLPDLSPDEVYTRREAEEALRLVEPLYQKVKDLVG